MRRCSENGRTASGDSVRFKSVADVADRLDVARTPRDGLDLCAQRGDAAVNAAWSHKHGTTPHRVENAIPRQSAARTAGEIQQEAEFFGGEIYLFTVPKEFVSR